MNTLDMFRLDDSVTDITAASSGVGVAFAVAFAQAGADVVSPPGNSGESTSSSTTLGALLDAVAVVECRGFNTKPRCKLRGKNRYIHRCLEQRQTPHYVGRTEHSLGCRDRAELRVLVGG